MGTSEAGEHRGATPRTVVLRAGVERLLSDCRAPGATGPVDVVDLGGGTGGEAVRLAVAGHRVTVVDPSPDALAALARRAREVDADASARVRAVQGDAEHLGDVLDAAGADLVLCHGVLEVVDDVAASLRGLRTVLRDGGRLSLLLAQRSGAVLARAAAGQLRQALAVATDPSGRWGSGDPLQRRFDAATVPDLLGAAGFTVLATEGVRAVADLVPHQLVDGDATATGLLARLEQHAGADADLSGAAPLLHVHAAPA